jgi:hypothetical protein
LKEVTLTLPLRQALALLIAAREVPYTSDLSKGINVLAAAIFKAHGTPQAELGDTFTYRGPLAPSGTLEGY